MRLLDLFAGIGGFSLAAHWMGWETVAFVERDKFCQKVLRKNFGQKIEIYDDITTFSGKPFRGRVDIVTGGFPCQPYSEAGKRKGTEDERHLWPEMLRTIREIRPCYVVGENVRGLISWSNGLVFEQVQSDLEVEGYEVLPFLLPACGVNAPHRRERVWFVGHLNGGDAVGERRATGSDADFRQREAAQDFKEWNGRVNELVTRNIAQRADSYAHARRVLDGIPDRVDRLKSLGNSVVPILIYEIFRAIDRAERVGE